MATSSPDHIPLVIEEKTVQQDVFEEVGGAVFMTDIYPLQYTARIVAAIAKKNGGTGTLQVWDMIVDKEIGSYTFGESEWHPTFFELDELPASSSDGVAHIELRMKNDGQGFAQVKTAALGVSP